jgi:hypothetical protein
LLIYPARFAIDFLDEFKQRFFFVRQPRRTKIFQNGLDKLAIFEKRRSPCGVRADSEWAGVSARSKSGYQLAHAGRKRRRPAHNALSEVGQMLCHIRFEREQMPDLRHRDACGFHTLDTQGELAFGVFLLHIFEKHWLHQVILLVLSLWPAR